jgi:hypothetical protein
MPGTIPLTSTGLTLVGGPSLITVDTGSKTLATLLGVTLASNLKRLKMWTAGTVYFASGTASASSAPLPTSQWISLDIRKAEADKLKFYASNVSIIVVQEG